MNRPDAAYRANTVHAASRGLPDLEPYKRKARCLRAEYMRGLLKRWAAGFRLLARRAAARAVRGPGAQPCR